MALAPLLWLTDGVALDDRRLAGYLDWLSPGELARHAAFLRGERRRQFLIGRVLLRQLLGQLLGMDAGAIVLQERSGAAPQLCHPAAPAVGLSIAHSGRWVACAASLDSKVGLDIEQLDPARDLAALAAQAFDDAACAALAALPEPERLPAFYALWCAQEARIKLGPHTAQGSAALRTDHLAIALCCSAPLAQPPQLTIRTL